MTKLFTWSGHKWLALATRLYLGSVFLFACFHKILNPAEFALDVATYQLLPLALVNVFALVLPWVELLAGLLLLLGVRVKAAALLTGGMMAMFMLGLAWALYLGLDMSCGCFASQSAAKDDPISTTTLLRDSVWLLQSLYILVFDSEPVGVENWVLAWRKKHA